jgi:hypothetical protein
MPSNNPEQRPGIAAKSIPFASEGSEEIEEITDHDKMKVECICPKCGQHHVMNLHWIGRGKPRKFCNQCKGLFG